MYEMTASRSDGTGLPKHATLYVYNLQYDRLYSLSVWNLSVFVKLQLPKWITEWSTFFPFGKETPADIHLILL